METVFISFSPRIWLYAGDPDQDVHAAGNVYPSIGDFFFNTSSESFYICFLPESTIQIWHSTTSTQEIESLISEIPQSDWTQSNSSSSDYIKNKPSLATVATSGSYNDLSGKPSLSTVATSGSYNDLSNKPTIPSAQVQSDWTQTSIVSVDFIKNKPSLSAVATSGSYNDLSGKPSLATVATSGSYNDLSNKPAIPAAQIQSDWTQASTGSLDFIKNKPSLSTVATTGSYNDLSNKPTIPSGQIQSDWTQSNSGSVDFIKNKPPGRTQSSASRSLNSVFQINSTRDSLVNYSVDIATSLSLTTGQSGTVFFEIASDSGFTTNVQELARFVNGNTGTLTIGLALSQNVTGTLSGYVPSGYYSRLRTANNTGTPTFTYRSGQEILL